MDITTQRAPNTLTNIHCTPLAPVSEALAIFAAIPPRSCAFSFSVSTIQPIPNRAATTSIPASHVGIAALLQVTNSAAQRVAASL